MKCTMICLDCSTTSSGVSIFVNGKYKESFLIDLKPMKGKAEDRLPIMMKKINDVFIKYNPQIVVYEMPVVSRNAQAQRNLSELAGAVWYMSIMNDSYIEFFRPTEWRKLISDESKGRKREELKQWSILKVKELYGVETDSDDISDSILLGTAYLNKYND